MGRISVGVGRVYCRMFMCVLGGGEGDLGAGMNIKV